MSSMSREPRWEECTICTAVAPDAVLTVRTYGTGSAYGSGLVHNFTLHNPRKRRSAVRGSAQSENVAQLGQHNLSRSRRLGMVVGRAYEPSYAGSGCAETVTVVLTVRPSLTALARSLGNRRARHTPQGQARQPRHRISKPLASAVAAPFVIARAPARPAAAKRTFAMPGANQLCNVARIMCYFMRGPVGPPSRPWPVGRARQRRA